MDIRREQPFVNQYHFDARNEAWEKEAGVPETKFRTDVQIINRDTETNTTTVVAIFQFIIVLENFVISGLLTQGNHLQNRILEDVSALTEEERRFLNEPLVDILQRLTYDVTEIAFDAPGLQLGLK